jgi:hypothetical protein
MFFLISSGIEFGFVTVVPKYLNFATFARDLLATVNRNAVVRPDNWTGPPKWETVTRWPTLGLHVPARTNITTNNGRKVTGHSNGCRDVPRKMNQKRRPTTRRNGSTCVREQVWRGHSLRFKCLIGIVKIGWGVMDWIDLAQGRDQWRLLWTR